MRLFLLLCAVLSVSVVFAQTPSEAGATKPTKPTVVRETLPDGMRLIVETRPDAPLTAIQLCVRVGSGQETPQNNGIAHMIEHLVFKGTATRVPGDFDRAMEAMGGEFTARTSHEATWFGTVVPATHTSEALTLLAEMVRQPAFRLEDLDKERAVIRAERAVMWSEPPRLGYERVSALIFSPSDPCRLPLMGTPENVARFTPDDLRAFHARWYQPGNMTLTLVGNVAPDEARRLVSRLFPAPPGVQGTATPGLNIIVPLNGIVRAAPGPPTAEADRELITLLVAFPCPASTDGDTIPLLDTLLPLLADGNQGRLVEQLVEKQHVAQTVTAAFLPGRTGSILLITAVTQPRDAARLEQAIADEIHRLREDLPTEDEKKAAQAITLSRAQYAAVTVEGSAERLMQHDIWNPSLTEEAYTQQVNALTTDDLKRAILRYLTPLRYAVVTVGPPAPNALSTPGETR